jgi:FlaA1/EpsC-like NDP-sugar epimerase
MILPSRNTPRWIIFLLDVFTTLVALVLAYLVRFEFSPPASEIAIARTFLPLFLLVRATSFVFGRTYAGIIRYTSTQDTLRIFTVLTSGTLLFVMANAVRFKWFDGQYFLPFSIVILEYLLSLFSMIVGRIAVKVLYMELKNPDVVRRRAAIFGAGEGGLLTKRTIDRDSRSGMQVVAFFDDDKSKWGKKLEGADIYATAKLEEFLSNAKIDELIIATPSLPKERKKETIDLALSYGIKVTSVPPAAQWVGGELSVRQFREVKIEDLLGREAIKLDSESVRAALVGKRVLISGAAGSIGSELVRQVLAYGPTKVVLLDQAETPLFELESELRSAGRFTACEIVIGDVRQQDRMKRLYDYFKPQVVFHAAAYKHVPLMESNPSEAVLTNVLGTKILADLSHEFGVEKFVFISTDKAVNPTSVMGASKRVAEMYVQSINAQSNTAFITTRFGNVLGSNGSVIPTFKKQIAQGGPVTVTHPDVTRFFMTIPEAAQLVLEAGAMGQGGEIFAFDMGESVLIADLAKKMVQLSGLEPGKDIEIKFTGLRPGEKLYEEVLSDKENTLPTHHPKIVVAQVRQTNYESVCKEVLELIDLFDAQDNQSIVKKVKSMVPEYVSNNSEFERLDK